MRLVHPMPEPFLPARRHRFNANFRHLCRVSAGRLPGNAVSRAGAAGPVGDPGVANPFTYLRNKKTVLPARGVPAKGVDRGSLRH